MDYHLEQNKSFLRISKTIMWKKKIKISAHKYFQNVFRVCPSILE